MSDLVEIARATSETLREDGMRSVPDTVDALCYEIERLQARNALLEDVAVAAESALDLWDHGAIKQQAINDLFAALDKLREVGDV